MTRLSLSGLIASGIVLLALSALFAFIFAAMLSEGLTALGF